jgi:hypothetical protein
VGVLDQVRGRARRTGAGVAKAGGDIVKAPSRLIRSLRSDGEGQTTEQKPAAGSGEPLFGDGVLGRVRSSALRVVAIAAGALLVIGWIAWAVYVTSENGATAGLGVVIAWPALISLVALPIAGLALLARRRGSDRDRHSTAAQAVEQGSDVEEADAENEAESEGAKDSDDDQGAKEPEGSEAKEVASG